MRRVLVTTIGLVSLIGATAAVAAKPPETKTSKSELALQEGLHAVALGASAQAQPSKDSPSQGAEHASDNAILRVCTKDNPAAQRAAICKNFVSPD
jgi:hypothetical protein